MSMENSNDTIENRTATFRLVAQCLNQLRHRVPTAAVYALQLITSLNHFRPPSTRIKRNPTIARSLPLYVAWSPGYVWWGSGTRSGSSSSAARVEGSRRGAVYAGTLDCGKPRTGKTAPHVPCCCSSSEGAVSPRPLSSGRRSASSCTGTVEQYVTSSISRHFDTTGTTFELRFFLQRWGKKRQIWRKCHNIFCANTGALSIGSMYFRKDSPLRECKVTLLNPGYANCRLDLNCNFFFLWSNSHTQV